MAKNKINTDIFDKAIILAVNAHKGIGRKGNQLPYILHPMEAAAITATMTEDQEMLAAAVLHDVVEDTLVTIEEIRREFGSRVAMLVESESEEKTPGMERETWHYRKAKAMERLSKSSLEIKMIAMGDKLSNIRAMYRDYQVIGEGLWKKFNNPNPIEQGMYYGLLANVFGEDEFIREKPAYSEYAMLCEILFSDERDGDGNLIE